MDAKKIGKEKENKNENASLHVNEEMVLTQMLMLKDEIASLQDQMGDLKRTLSDTQERNKMLEDILTKKSMVRPKRFMIVEDESIITLVIERYVQKMGFEVAGIANNPGTALKMMKEKNPDMILMDIQLNGMMNGIEVMKEIRKFSKVPVLFISGNSEEMIKGKTKSLTYSGILAKPVKYEQLVIEIQKLLQHKNEMNIKPI